MSDQFSALQSKGLNTVDLASCLKHLSCILTKRERHKKIADTLYLFDDRPPSIFLLCFNLPEICFIPSSWYIYVSISYLL